MEGLKSYIEAVRSVMIFIGHKRVRLEQNFDLKRD